MTDRVTRLAPSPTGALHLGNARTFLLTWAIARQRGWRILMRVEDLDGPRVKPESRRETLDTLAWLGLDFDGPATTQSDDLDPYRNALAKLVEAGNAYRCEMSRADVEAALSAPHAGDGEVPYPAHLRPVCAMQDRWRLEGPPANFRFVVGESPVVIDDEIAGRRTFHPAAEVGDFVIWTKRGVPAYQLAVVVDDARQGVTDVLRGDDLLPSAARQALLYEAMGLSVPRWWHMPLVVGPDGRRLAKRHGDTRVATYREKGVASERVIGLLAWWSGGTDTPRDMSAREFAASFDVSRLPRGEITFTEQDHAWLLHGTSHSPSSSPASSSSH